MSQRWNDQAKYDRALARALSAVELALQLASEHQHTDDVTRLVQVHAGVMDLGRLCEKFTADRGVQEVK